MKNDELLQILQRVRRDLHRMPEIGFAVTKTRAYLANILKGAGFTPREVAGGLVADIGQGAPKVLLRADMDALPITDEKTTDYASALPGCCHACGHDAHMAMVFGAGLLLRDEFAGVGGAVRLVFQPAEECPPGGALGMIEAGVLDGIEAAFALHVHPHLPFGAVGLKAGQLMATADNIRLTVTGQGGHGAMPQGSVDAIVAASHVVVGLQSLASRMIDPTEPFVLTIGKIRGGDASNVVAGRVELEGTVRTLNSQTRDAVEKKIYTIAAGICDAYGAGLELQYTRGYPLLENHKEMVELVRQALENEGMGDNIISLEKPMMGGEDFSYFLRQVPGCFIFLGTKKGDDGHPLHHPQFDFDENVLPLGAQLLKHTVCAFLQKNNYIHS